MLKRFEVLRRPVLSIHLHLPSDALSGFIDQHHHSFPSWACWTQNSSLLLPATPYDGCLVHLGWPHLSLAASVHHPVLGVTGAEHCLLASGHTISWLRRGADPVAAPLLAVNITMPSGACWAQNSGFLLPATPYNGPFGAARVPSPPGHAGRGTRPSDGFVVQLMWPHVLGIVIFSLARTLRIHRRVIVGLVRVR